MDSLRQTWAKSRQLIFPCPIPNAQCPMPNTQYPMPNTQCPMPYS
ncbi:MAG: hypothetical protein ACHBN1_23490 [Heteroscytonema crispum UTEX LB 1556]